MLLAAVLGKLGLVTSAEVNGAFVPARGFHSKGFHPKGIHPMGYSPQVHSYHRAFAPRGIHIPRGILADTVNQAQLTIHCEPRTVIYNLHCEPCIVNHSLHCEPCIFNFT